MTVGEWMAAREAGAPGRLVEGMRKALGSGAARPDAESAQVLLEATVAELQSWLDGDMAARNAALRLLTIDGLATLAMEGAAESPASLDGFANLAILRIARLRP